MTKYLAVYGTLRSDHPTEFGRRMRDKIQDNSVYEAEVTISGLSLHDLGSYPAAIPGEGAVRAELYGVPNANWDSLIRSLNAYEGGAYRLREMTAFWWAEDSENECPCYVYVWEGGNLHPRNAEIPDGDWVKHFKQREAAQ